jgi:hypothetical protein
MIGLKIKDIDRDILLIFAMSYEYSLSFTNMVKLFTISRKYFWTFMEICTPMLKMGVRKASLIKKTAEKLYDCFIKKEGALEALTPREEKILEAFNWFIEDSFTDGEGCLHLSQFKTVPFAKAYGKNGLLVASNFENMEKNVDNIAYIQLGNDRFHKTSRFLYYMEKFSGDTDVRELETLSIKEMLRRISDGEDKLREKEIEEAKKLNKQFGF